MVYAHTGPFDVQITGTGDLNAFETLTLNCITNESASIMWRFNDGTNGQISLSSTHYAYIRDDSANTASSTLIIAEATESDGGTYTCVADTNGTRLPITKDFTVTVRGNIILLRSLYVQLLVNYNGHCTKTSQYACMTVTDTAHTPNHVYST